MPAVAEGLKQEFSWEPRLTDPDLAVAKGAALYAAGPDRPVRRGRRERRGRRAAAGGRRGAARCPAPGPVTDGGRAGGSQPGSASTRSRSATSPSAPSSTCCPRPIGVKLLDTTKPNWEDDPEAASYIEHLSTAQTQLPCTAADVRGQHHHRQPDWDRDRDLGAGR